MAKSNDLRFGALFGELHYRYGRALDGIDRSPGALTAEHTYRVVLGFPEVYITCIYKWVEVPIAAYLSAEAIKLGKRLGKNVLIVPIEGNEEEFWADAREVVRQITKNSDDGVELDDKRVFLLISGYNPQILLEENLPFLLCDVTELTVLEFIGFFSKLLDLFDVNLESNLFGGQPQLGPTAGRTLLNSARYQESSKADLHNAVQLLAEITFVLEKMHIHFCRFQWSIKDALRVAMDAISENSELRVRLIRAKERFKDVPSPAGYIGAPRLDVAKRIVHQTIIEDVVMGDKYVTGQAGAVGPGSVAHDMQFQQTRNQPDIGIDLQRLAEELSILQTAMKREQTAPEHDRATEAVAAAKAAAKAGNGPKTIEQLKSAGKWTLDLAMKIGTSVASDALKRALGL